MSGCAMPELSLPKKQSTNEHLPMINSFNTISDMTQIAFEWQRVDDPEVAGYEIYRAQNGEELKKIATIKDKYATHYVDTKLSPATTYEYAMATYDKNGASSLLGTRYSVQTEQALGAVEFVQVLSDLPTRAKVIWAPHDDVRVSGYIIERNDMSENKWKKIAEVKGRLVAEYIDTNLIPAHTYSYRIIAKTSDGVKSAVSEQGSANVKPLPHEVLNLIASSKEPKKIVLSWERSPEEDIKHYVIYSARSNYLPATKLATTQDTRYEDYIDSNGATRYYKVTAVDITGGESPKQEAYVQGSTLPAPNEPSISTARYNGASVELAWSGDSRSRSYKIYKKSKSGAVIIPATSTSYYDGDIEMGQSYTYEISALDEYGLESDKSRKAIVETK